MNVSVCLEMLRINPERVISCLGCELKKFLEETDRDGVVVGLSGGLDSGTAAAICVRALGPERVRGVHMPDRDSLHRHTVDARLLAKILGIDLKIIDLTKILARMRVYELLGNTPTEQLRELVEQEHRRQGKEEGRELFMERLRTTRNPFIAASLAYGCAKHGLRALELHELAMKDNLVVVSTGNKSEIKIGYFSDHGPDATGHFAMLNQLYRTQVEMLAEYLRLPEQLLNKPSDPDVIPGANDKVEFMFMDSWAQLDGILACLEQNLDKHHIANLLEVDTADVEYVESLVKLQANKKPMPYTPHIIV